MVVYHPREGMTVSDWAPRALTQGISTTSRIPQQPFWVDVITDAQDSHNLIMVSTANAEYAPKHSMLALIHTNRRNRIRAPTLHEPSTGHQPRTRSYRVPPGYDRDTTRQAPRQTSATTTHTPQWHNHLGHLDTRRLPHAIWCRGWPNPVPLQSIPAFRTCVPPAGKSGPDKTGSQTSTIPSDPTVEKTVVYENTSVLPRSNCANTPTAQLSRIRIPTTKSRPSSTEESQTPASMSKSCQVEWTDFASRTPTASGYPPPHTRLQLPFSSVYSSYPIRSRTVAEIEQQNGNLITRLEVQKRQPESLSNRTLHPHILLNR
ncbi:hypothetical protein HPB48_013625 [Haemaphysalis longicornis]|uniref:Uncharacterized protein n=1 Tax=Haemaphysalis longicornis TaxID=44386 RepID=A0A9J6GMH1_HAELO|nr:hypothetical protein HPB48_013625 [Haemaphysalis longicornis]